jgi:hypothetical protein
VRARRRVCRRAVDQAGRIGPSLGDGQQRFRRGQQAS